MSTASHLVNERSVQQLHGRRATPESLTHLREDQALDPRRRALEQRHERRDLGRALDRRRAAVPATPARAADAARAGAAKGRDAALGGRRDDVLAGEGVAARWACAARVDGHLDAVMRGIVSRSCFTTPREETEEGAHQFWQKKCWQMVMRPSAGQSPHARHSAPASLASLRSPRRYDSCSADMRSEFEGMPVAFSWSCWMRAASLRSRML